MRRKFLPTLGSAGVAAMPLMMALVISACDGTSEPIGSDAVYRPAGELARPSQSAIPTEPILDVVNGVTAAWTAHDPAAYASFYAADMTLINPRGAVIAGRDAFRAQHAFLFSGPFAGSTQTITVRDIQFLSGTIAIVYQDVALTGYAFLLPGLVAVDGVVRTNVTWVVEKRAGRWEIVMQQMTQRL